MNEHANLDQITQHPLTPGAVGAVIGLRWAPGASWPDKAINVVGGAACAAYLGPLVCSLLRLTAQPATAAIGFALGLFGLSLVGAVMDGIRNIKLADVASSWLTRR